MTGTRRWLVLVAIGVGIGGTWQLGEAATIHAKAWLAQVLIADAWERAMAGDTRPAPWPWADTWPVAHLRAPRQGIETFVLAGASGRTLAFGPGHMDGTPLPGAPGNSVVTGHRDTHFRFLADIAVGDPLEVAMANGESRRFRVSGTQVVDATDAQAVIDGDEARLTLVTCYPFDAVLPGSLLRYVVTAEAVPVMAEVRR